MNKIILDPAAAYVIVTGGQFAGHALAATAPAKFVDEPSKPGEFTIEQGQQLLEAGKIQLAGDLRPTPVEKPEDAVVRLSDIEAVDGGKFLIRAPWMNEAETIKGENEARARLLEVQEAGLEVYRSTEAVAAKSLSPANAAAAGAAAITGEDGFSIVENGSNGYFDVIAPGKEPERVRGRANADKRLAELRAEAATPPLVVGPIVDDTADED